MYKTTIPILCGTKYFNREKALAECRRSGAQRVALIIDRELNYRFSSPETLAMLKEHIACFKENGFEVLVWLAETVGHDADEPIPGPPYHNMRFFGKKDISAFCILDPLFREAVSNWVKEVAACGADMIMLDDDFRLRHSGGLACCCPLHMAKLEEALQTHFTEDEFLHKAFLGGKNKYRDAFIKVCGDGKREFAAALRASLDTVNPNVRLGFCAATSAWDFDGADAIEISKLLAGSTKPFLRLCGAPYWCRHDASFLAAITERNRVEADWCKNSGIEIFSEGDTYPRPRFTSSSAFLECYDMILRASGETDGILKYMLDYVSDADYETGYIDSHVRNRKLYQEIDRLFAGKRSVGVRPFIAMKIFENMEIPDLTPERLSKVQNFFDSSPLDFATYNSLPISYEKGQPVIVFGENARYIPPAELKDGAILDLSAAELLTQRGIDVGLLSVEARPDYNKTSLIDMPHEYFIEEDQQTLLMQSSFPKITWKPQVRTITRLSQGGETFAGVCEYENQEGMKFMLLPMCFDQFPEGFLKTYARRRQILRSLLWMCGKKPPIDIDGNYPFLYPMIKKNDTAIAVGLWNLFNDRIDGLRLQLNLPCENIRFVNCKGHLEQDKIILDTTLYPYEFAGLEITLPKEKEYA